MSKPVILTVDDDPLVSAAIGRDLLHHDGADYRVVRFRAEPTLFAAPLVQRRDGSWVLVGFRNQEPQGLFSFEIIDPVEVAVDGDGLQAV